MKAIISLKNKFFRLDEIQAWTYQDSTMGNTTGILEVFLRYREKPIRIYCNEEDMKEMIKTIEAVRE